jgi:hypothetical protein
MARAQIAVTLWVTLVFALAWTPDSTRAVETRADTVTVKIPRGRLTANKPLTLAGQTLGVTADDRDVTIALDADKSYVVYETECSGYAIVDSTSDENDRCRREVADPRGAARRDGEGDCRRCRRVVAWIDRGGVWRDATSGQADEASRPRRNPLTRPVVLLPLAAAVGTGTVLALRGDDEPAAPPFAGLANSTFRLDRLQGNNGCPGFTPTAVATMTFNPDPTTGAGSASVQYSGSSTNYSNARAVRNGTSFDITASGASVVTPIRSFSAQLQATVQAITGTGTTVVRFVETFTQLNGPGSPCNQTFSQ